MMAMETKLDVVANNLANMETTAFKRDRANFEDLIYRHEVYPGAQDSAGQYTPTGTQIGLGVRTQSTQTEFTQGPMQTNRPGIGRGHRGHGLLPGDQSRRPDRLHQGGKFGKKCQRQSGDRLGQRRAFVGAAHRYTPGCHGHHHYARRHCYRPTTGQQPNDAGGPNPIGFFHQSARIAQTGSKIYIEKPTPRARRQYPIRARTALERCSKACWNRPTSSLSRN